MNFGDYIIRQLCVNDTQIFFDLINNNRKRLEDFFPGTISKNKSIEETMALIPGVISKAENRTYFSFIILDTRTARPVGYIDIKNIDWRIPRGELGYFIDEHYEGKGISTKAVSEIIKHCTHDLNFIKLFLRTHDSNTGSKRVAEKNGFIIEGLIRNDHRKTNGEIVDLIYYGLVPTN